jgi:hypothetical protein
VTLILVTTALATFYVSDTNLGQEAKGYIAVVGDMNAAEIYAQNSVQKILSDSGVASAESCRAAIIDGSRGWHVLSGTEGIFGRLQRGEFELSAENGKMILKLDGVSMRTQSGTSSLERNRDFVWSVEISEKTE